jgi:hypothetical protein
MRERRGAYNALPRKLQGKRLIGNLRVDGRIILNWIFEKWDRGMDWINLTHNRGRWPAVANGIMNLRVP